MRLLLVKENPIKPFITSIFLGLAATTALTAIPTIAAAQISGRFSAILVVGNQTLPSQTVIAFSGIDLTQNLSSADINEALRRLFASGLFADVDIRAAAGRLVITVVENQTIGIVNFEGNSSFSDAELASLVTSQARRPLDRATIESDARRIAQLYTQSAQFTAQVTPLIIQLTDGRANLVFEIAEGRVNRVESVSFVGNSQFSDRRLRRVIPTSESGFLNFLFNSDNFSLERANADRAALLEFYRDRGFVDVDVRSGLSEFALDRDGFFLTYTVNEGAIFNFGNASVSTELAGVDIAEFERLIKSRPGRIYKASKVEDTIEAIEAEATRRGLPFLRAVPRVTKNEADGTIDINYVLVNGQRLYVERIDIRGNSQTLDRVIRREFEMAEGDAFNPRKMREAEAALRRLRFFSNLSVSVREGATPETAIIEVDVEDTSTGSFNFGAGFSTDSGISANFSITERNFLGRGQRFALSVDYGESSQSISFGFTEPALFDRDLAAGFDIYYRSANRSESSYQTTAIGLEPNFAFPVGEDSRANIGYKLASIEIRDTILTTSPIITEGTVVTSSISFGLSIDKRDSSFDPTSGYILRLNTEYAGLGGDTQFSRSTARVKGYFSLFDQTVVLSADLEGGSLFTLDGGNSRITDRFFLGGQNFRGFSVGGIGPRDDDGLTINDSLGGNFYAVARLDATFPLGLPEDLGIRGGVFLDAGSVWGLDGAPVGASGVIDTSAQLRASAGFALYWNTPIGPLVFNWSNPFLSVAGDETQSFSVSVRTGF